mgnify:CR=1 FL=1
MPDRQRKETLAADGRAGADLPDERLGNYRPRVLLVDDQPENLVALRAVAETLDVDAVCAESGMAALRELLHSDFAIIVLDVQMPELDGFETAQLIKSRERSRNVPILFLTAIHREERYALRAYGLGAADYVTKPVDAEVLRAKLKAEGYSSYTETVGDKVRVRAGPFPNKAATDKAAVRIQKILGVQASVAAKQ